jgi:hypothetical protein
MKIVSQKHGSADLDPDPHQNVMDPQHWKKSHVSITLTDLGLRSLTSAQRSLKKGRR